MRVTCAACGYTRNTIHSFARDEDGDWVCRDAKECARRFAEAEAWNVFVSRCSA